MSRDRKRDPLVDLLGEADAAAPPPPAMLPGLAGRVRARRRAQVRRQAAAAVVALPAGALAVSLTFLPSRHNARNGDVAQSNGTVPVDVGPTATHESADPKALAAEIKRLQSEAAIRLSVVDGLQARHARRQLEARVASLQATGSAPDAARLERDKAALTLIDHGDRLRRDFKEVDAALAAYRRAIELFPDTRWAAVAKQRIDALQTGASVPTDPSSLS